MPGWFCTGRGIAADPTLRIAQCESRINASGFRALAATGHEIRRGAARLA
jgi:hypothetical protein